MSLIFEEHIEAHRRSVRSPAALVFAAIVFAILALSSSAHAGATAGSDESLSRVRKAGVLRWGGDIQGGEPYVYDDPTSPGKLVGFEVDIADAIAKRLGVRQEFVQNDWSQLLPSLERRTFDVIMNGLEVTPARIGRIRFSHPYYVFAERLMVRKNETAITSLEALGQHRVGTLTNSLAFELLRGKNVVTYEGVEEPYFDLAAGRTDAVLLDDIIATRYGAPKKELKVVADVSEGYYAIGLRPEDATLADAIDIALTNIAASGELDRILAKAKISNPREARLAAWSDVDQKQMLGSSPPPPATMSLAHVVLFLKGAGMTLLISILAMAIAVPLGLFLAIVRAYFPRKWAFFANAYVEIYRGTPVLLQLYLLYYGIAFVVRLDAIVAAIIGLGMNYAAYEAETYRAGFSAVPVGQMEAALSLGMSRNMAIRRVLLPQVLKHALPNVTNDFIALLKDSSLVSVLTVVELTKRMTITAVDVRSWAIPGLLCAALYFAMSYPLSLLARRIERKLEGTST